MRPLRARAHPALLPPLLALATLAGGCRSTPESDPRYRPSENVLEVVAVLRRHVPDDTYRFEPARDFAGRNVYRASLVRLENLERVHADALRAGHMDGVIAFSKGRALERIRAFALAAEHYRRAAELEEKLAADARRSAAVCDALAEASELGFDLGRPALAGDPGPPRDPEAVIAAFELRMALLEALLADHPDDHYHAVIREEMERADVLRAGWFVAARRVSADGNVRALGELQRVIVRHRESKNANRHLLSLADLYADLATEYAEAHPPESMAFDPPMFQDLVDAASRLYEAVANQDGTAEKLEAARRLEAFLAFTLRVDRDRFSQ
jgi:tetratricopeptide (TPR) repeat protein